MFLLTMGGIIMSKIYILYHASCTDGLGAKYAAWKKFGDGATYIPVQYKQDPPEMDKDSEVYILDFSYPLETLIQLKSVHKRVVVIDHHKTAEEILRGLDDCHFDMNKSGAVLAYEYFHPNTDIPLLLQYIQDRDLWKFEMDGTKEILTALSLLEDDIQEWDKRINELPDFIGRLYEEGKSIKKWSDVKIKSYIENKIKVIKYKNYRIGVANVTEWISEIGNAICNYIGYTSGKSRYVVDFSMTYFISPEGKAILSFRSIGEMDVSLVAKELGGGGHCNSAGASVSLSELERILTELPSY